MGGGRYYAAEDNLKTVILTVRPDAKIGTSELII
jgi:hypothetical protein